jgi:hypothetical protein
LERTSMYGVNTFKNYTFKSPSPLERGWGEATTS